VTGKYTLVVDANWDDRILFPESVPHLFHFDLFYLWMLERDPDRRSRAWSERIEGWRYLTALFLLGELLVEEEEIREPFLAFTRPFGIERVSWLKGRTGPDQFGVLSPTVLVRPLPDFTGPVLDRWRQELGDLSRRGDEIRHFVDLAVGRLTEGENPSQPTFRSRFARVLEREFGARPLAHAPGGRQVSVPFLHSLGWARPRLKAEAPSDVSLLVRDGGDRQIRTYVPRCSRCSELLTRTLEEPPIDVRGSSFQTVCPQGHTNELSLANLLIWYRSTGQIVVWRDDHQTPVESPPPRNVQGAKVDIEWNEGRVGGDRRRRFLQLRFPDVTVREHSLEEIFFEKILVPGRLEGFRGLPIRPEWIDVLQNPEQVEPDADPSVPRIVYRNLSLGGWPVPVSRVFGGLSLAMREDLALGLYPDPARMGPDWKWFRAFLDGPGRDEHSLGCVGAEPVFPWISETSNGLPQVIWTGLPTDPGTGATFIPRRPAPGAVLPPARAHVGIDFGTSNTLIGFYEIERGGGLGQPATLAPEALLDLVAWLAAPPAGAPWEGATGGFLPPRGYRSTAEDRHLIPSALWMMNHQQQIRHLVRWDGREPLPGAEALSGFKWDLPRGTRESERHAYLREVLLLGLPAILAQTARMQTVTDVDLGFAFPLAFDYDARSKMLGLLDRLGSGLQQITGLRFHFMHLNESQACVNAFGMFRQGETFLVADMGGGTIDVALFTMGYEGRTEMHQIGSLRFAGEDGLWALAKKKGSSKPGDTTYWRLRDLIMHGQARELYGRDRDGQKVVDRLVTYSFEYLRTMVAAFRRQQPGKAIRVVLVGNGWHLADALSDRARQRGAPRFFSELYRHFLEQLGEPDLELYQGDPLRNLPSSKHLVVRGALENTAEVQRQELPEEGNLSRLPAGRSLFFEPPQRDPIRIGWEHILGEDESVALQGISRADLRPEHLRIDFGDMPPPAATWRPELLDAFQARDESGIPYPDEPQLRRRIASSIERNRVGLGPLQVILEDRWREELSK
jgi:hypothetical protein